jgi:hypothetical protein
VIYQKTLRKVAIILTLALAGVGIHRAGIAAQLTLTWSDNSSNENGFKIERRVGTTGTYAQIASVGINVKSYIDTNLLNSTTYCYRIRSYNSAGSSAYSNESCAKTLAASSLDTTAPVLSNGASSAMLAAGTKEPTLSLTTNVVNDLVDKVGIYRPSTGEWFLDQNGNGTWDGCEVDICVQSFSAAGALPVVGDWDGSEFTKLGLFLPSTSQWQLDLNGDRTWDGCALDKCQESFGESGDMPVAGKWTTAGSERIGTFRTDNGTWYLDASGNGKLNCLGDYCFRFSNYANGDIPVAGDWTGSGTSRVGLYRPSTAQWFLDRNGSRSWNGCSKDTCVNDFGAPGDLPITGDWSGNGISKIGIFRPSTQEWMLDLNGNGSWDGCDVDLCVSGFGAEGDVPVVGRW